ncbi:MAG: 50S ribosomal protein L10, partial [Oligoflexia bacterium]|nr:50S ribosomal protein L10 [Oligoflexia bacterium]
MLNRETKKAQVSQLADSLSKSKASFLVNCIGLNVEQMTALRKNLKQNKGNIQVIRNTLSLRAMEDNEMLKKTYSPFMKGPNAFVLAFDDVAKVAKIIDELAEEHEVFKIKGAVLEDRSLSQAEVKTLAQLPSHEVLKAQF